MSLSHRKRFRKCRSTRSLLNLEFLEDRLVPTLLGNTLFPIDNPWNQRITNAPVSPQSAGIMSSIISRYGNGRLHPDFGQDYHTDDALYGIPYTVVHGNTQPKVNVVIDGYPDESDIQPVPIPGNAVLEGDNQNGPAGGRGDSHLLVYDVDNNILYELYATTRPSENADRQWHADQESIWNLNTNSFRTLGWTSADAAGLPILPGLARPDEALPLSQGGQGVITHAIRMTLQNAVILNQFIYPASHVANRGNTNVATQPPMGARFRLKASVDISQLNPQARIVAQAMKDYGLIVADNGSNFYISGASNSVDASNNESLTWNDDDVQDSVRGLKSLTFNMFEVVDLTPVLSSLSTTSGQAGITVTVSGQNFSGAAGRLQILFGSTPATLVTVVDDGHVTAVVPAGSGSLDVRIVSGISDPGNSQNIKSPIFGYGQSAIVSAARFTYAAPQSGLQLAGLTSPLTAGAQVSFTVTALKNGTPDSSYRGTVHFTSTDGAATLPANYTFTAADQGVHTFTLTLKTAGAQTVSTTDTANAGFSSTVPLTVNPGQASVFTLGLPTQGSAGIAFAATITVNDSFGNVATGYRGTVKWSSSDGLAALPGSYTFTASDNGRHAFSVKLGTAGTQSVTVSDTAQTSLKGTSSVAVTDELGLFVTQAYQDLLGRVPDPAGKTYWVGLIAGGAPRSAIATQLTHSAEYYSTIITPAYQTFLGRPPDASGLNYWIGRMQQGLRDEQLQAGFIASPEYYQHAGTTNKGWIDALYLDLLGRPADSGGENFWLQQLAGGVTRLAIANGFTASIEGAKTRVLFDYEHFLRRSPSTTELDYWAAQFARGTTNEDIVAGFIGSDEYFQTAVNGS
ncbi:hypothetical protein BH10PLA2_BH10PLA2_19640 [soil metagenome]